MGALAAINLNNLTLLAPERSGTVLKSDHTAERRVRLRFPRTLFWRGGGLHGGLGRKDTKLLCIQSTDCFCCHLNKDCRREEKGKGCFQDKSRRESTGAKEKGAGICFFFPFVQGITPRSERECFGSSEKIRNFSKGGQMF